MPSTHTVTYTSTATGPSCQGAIWAMTTFNWGGVSGRVFGKVEYVEYLRDLFGMVKEEHLEIPDHVREYDRDLIAGKL